MDIAEVLGPERWHETLNAVFAVLTGAVHEFEGSVNQYTGDGIMALFGAPIAAEDHVRRACLAALAIQERLAPLAAKLVAGTGYRLQAPSASIPARSSSARSAMTCAWTTPPRDRWWVSPLVCRN